MLSVEKITAEERKSFYASLVIRECMHFFTPLEDPGMIRKIKPQEAQKITESCYFYLSPPLCHSVSSVVFRKPYFENIEKVSGVLVTATRNTKDPFLFASAFPGPLRG